MDVEMIDTVTSRWCIQGPLGIKAHRMIRVTEECTNELTRYEMVTLPSLRTFWEIHFVAGPGVGETEVSEVMKIPFGTLGRVALALIGKFPAEEVPSNLGRLKQLMETGEVTYTSHAVAGKFVPRLKETE